MGYFIDPSRDIFFSFSPLYRDVESAGPVNEELSKGRQAFTVLFRDT